MNFVFTKLCHYLIVEAIDFVDVAAFVVPSEQEEVGWKSHFEGQQQHNGLDALLSPVYVICERAKKFSDFAATKQTYRPERGSSAGAGIQSC